MVVTPVKCDNTERLVASWRRPATGGDPVVGPQTEPPSNDRWQAEPDTSWGDRPGIVASLLRYRVIVVAAALLGAVAGYFIAQQLPVRYRAEAVLILSDPGDPTVLGGGGSALGSSDRQVYLAKQADIMTSSVVLERAVKLLGTSQSVADLKAQLDVKPAANLASMSIDATTADPRSAAALANAVGTAYEQITKERVAADAQRVIASLEAQRGRVQTTLDASPPSPDGQLSVSQQQLSAQIASLQQREQDITTQVQVYDSGVDYFERAQQPTSPSQPKPKLFAALGGFLGLLAAGAWAWRRAARDQRAESREEPARILEAPLLGEVPEVPLQEVATASTVLPKGVHSSDDDAHHFVVTSIEHELAEVGGKSIALTGVGHGDSTTSTALQIASAASREDRKVLLIDADARTRLLSDSVRSIQAASGRNGQKVSMRRAGAGADEYVDRLVPTAGGMVLPVRSNGTDPAGSYRAVDVRPAMRSLGEMFDLVLIDAPALLASPDALDVAGQADGVVVVVPHRVALSHLRAVRDRLAFVKTPLIGYVYVRPHGVRVRSLRTRIRPRSVSPDQDRRVGATQDQRA
jgi:capsular polysaccharide biosynthesis protein